MTFAPPILDPTGTDHLPLSLSPWVKGSIEEVPAMEGRHTIHSYFVACPESPDGTRVAYYTSATADGEIGDIRTLDLATGVETILAQGVRTEDAHRAACQQWIDGGRSVVFHDCRNGIWCVVAVDALTGRERVLAENRQIGFGAPNGKWVPVYSCHWNPGPQRDLELIHIDTGEVRTAVTIRAAIAEYREWIDSTFGTEDLSIFFPVMSPDGKRVIFKIAQPAYGDDFRSWKASKRHGMAIFDLETSKFIRLVEQWGHPSWHPDSRHICEKGNFLIDIQSGEERPFGIKSPSDHPSITTNGNIFVTDSNIDWRDYGGPGQWAIFLGSVDDGTMVKLHQFDNSQGATTWRGNHPHPVFNAAGTRFYFNTNSSPWTRLYVATRRD